MDTLQGLIERVTFHNPDNGFAVLKVKAKGQREHVPVIGNVAVVNPGEHLSAEGTWLQDRNHGRQFKAERIQVIPPSNHEGIIKYLSSGLVKGIGPTYAKKLVAKFGEDVFDIIETRSAKLQEIPGIGTERRRRIKSAWESQKVVREIMIFLHSNGVSTSRAVRIYKTYGAEAVDKVRSDPYALAREISGIGFKSSDVIAANLGIPHDSPKRAAGGLNHILSEATSKGHTCLPLTVLSEKTRELLNISEKIIETAIGDAVTRNKLISLPLNGTPTLFLPHLRRAEETIASSLLHLAKHPSILPAEDISQAIAKYEGREEVLLAEAQKQAVQNAVEHRVTVVTGGPGVGKTTVVKAIIHMFERKGLQPLLAAPTGRAAKRLTESTGGKASTIHRLLEFQPGKGFTRNEDNPIEADLLVIDETSMLDVPLMHSLTRAIGDQTHVVFVGDINQLPSVGPGSVLHNLISSNRFPVARLTEVFRQAAGSRIITTAHQINTGDAPDLASTKEELSDFYFIERETPDAVRTTLFQLIQQRIPKRFKMHPIHDVQVLTPMNRGSLGVRDMNHELQELLNPEADTKKQVEKYGMIYREGDKVMQLKNNYDKNVFNGDLGTISKVVPEEEEVHVDIDGAKVVFEFGELDELTLAYASTIHKSQGSEYPCVIIPISTQHFVMLQRNLIYTGITRGKQLVILIGQEKALKMAIRNNETAKRYSSLLELLQSG